MRFLGRVVQELIHLLFVRQRIDLLGGIRGAFVSRNYMRADKQQKLSAGCFVVPATEQVAQDRDFIKETELSPINAMFGRLQSTEHNHLAVMDVNERSGLSMPNDRLVDAVDVDCPDDIVDLLINLKLNASIVTNEGSYLHVDSNVLIGNL